MRIIIYEDRPENFFPLINFYPQFNLRLGMKTIAEHNASLFPKFKFEFIAREIFKFQLKEKNEPTIYLSSRLLLTDKVALPCEEVKFTSGGEIVGFLKNKPPFPKNLREISIAIRSIEMEKEVSGIVLEHLWDIIRYNEEMINVHFRIYKEKGKSVKNFEIDGKSSNLYIERTARVSKFVFFDTTSGPIYIDRRVLIRPFTTIIGPAYIGEGTIVERAKIVKSSIGPYCRIGGEVESCVFQGFSNKYHEGFIGHSFIGEWVNIGSLTTNSDLKNNYSNVRIKIGEREYDTKMVKLGCFIGDHTKLGIGTLIPTGAVIGSFVNYFGGGMMPKYVPSFRWLGPGVSEIYELEKAISTMKIVMKRRGVILTKEYENLIRESYQYLLTHI
uniref:Glucose-1-phosphate thymidylyltransferase n=1 Tax=candidate division WOR-3 bacterium TaxID=2052148 RepID=A0A7C4XDN0_UNCW3